MPHIFSEEKIATRFRSCSHHNRVPNRYFAHDRQPQGCGEHSGRCAGDEIVFNKLFYHVACGAWTDTTFANQNPEKLPHHLSGKHNRFGRNPAQKVHGAYPSRLVIHPHRIRKNVGIDCRDQSSSS